jgi:hypothetical protein
LRPLDLADSGTLFLKILDFEVVVALRHIHIYGVGPGRRGMPFIQDVVAVEIDSDAII